MTAMDDRQTPRRVVEFERLNLLGKAVFAGGWMVRIAANGIQHAVDRSATVLAEAERAYRQGRDPHIDDAKVIEEREERRR